MGSQAESVSSSLTSPAEQWLMPGSWADGAAGCAGGVGWVWGGWDGDGLVYSQDQALCPEGGESCCCVWSTAGAHWDQQWNPVPTLAAQVWCCPILLPSAFTHEPIRAWLFCQESPSPQSLPAARMWSHAPKNHQHQGTTVTLSSSVPCHGWGHCAPLPPYIPSLPENVATPTLSVSIIPHAKQILTYTFFFCAKYLSRYFIFQNVSWSLYDLLAFC